MAELACAAQHPAVVFSHLVSMTAGRTAPSLVSDLAVVGDIRVAVVVSARAHARRYRRVALLHTCRKCSESRSCSICNQASRSTSHRVAQVVEVSRAHRHRRWDAWVRSCVPLRT